MTTYYAALGRYELEKLPSGTQKPVIYKAGREYGVTMSEFIIWSTLLWNILNCDALKADCLRKAERFGVDLHETEFELLLDRLVTRGLVASGQGYTNVQALYELLGGVSPSPVRLSRLRKFLGFLALLLHGHPFGVARHIFDRENLDAMERSIWVMISQQKLSTAEVIHRLEPDVEDVADDSMKHLGCLTPKMYSALAAVASLYLKRMIILENNSPCSVSYTQ